MSPHQPLGEHNGHHVAAELRLRQLDPDEHIAHLETALTHARRIGAAIGILMERCHVDDEAAFEMLRQASMDENIPLYNLAERLVEAGSAPGIPRR